MSPADDTRRAIRLAYGEHPAQFAHHWPAVAGHAARPLLMLLHGGYWRERYGLEHMEPMAAALATAGWHVLNVEYRRGPGAVRATVADLQAALRVLPATIAGAVRDASGARFAGVAAVGFSAGGQLALWLAAQGAPLAAVVALAPVADLQRARALRLSHDAVDEWLGGGGESLPPWDPCQLPAPSIPVALLHGDADTDVPVEQSRRYAQGHPRAQFECLPGVDHFALVDPHGPAWPTVMAAIARLAADTPA